MITPVARHAVPHFIILLAAGVIAQNVASQGPGKPPTPSPSKGVAEKIDAIFSPLADKNSPGLAVLVVKDGRKLFERGYGVRDLRGGAKIDEHTNFRLASCSKQFTAMSIMLLVHDGKLR
ncbi:MAG: serine hydrolase domain-containing protein, partial [Candidatus Acidiferrum sp.]